MIDYIKSNAEYLNIRSIEKSVGIPQGLLNKVIRGDRSLPDKYRDGLGEIVFRLTRGAPVKKTSVVSKPNEKKVVKKQTDEKWDLASNYKSSVAGYKVVNGHAQKPVIRDGKLMVRL